MDDCRCCVGSRCEPTDTDTCREIHGECHGGGGNCLTRSFLDQILADIGDHLLAPLIAGGTISRIDDLRDRVLVNSPLGRRALAYNRRFADEVLAILREDSQLFLETGRVFLMAARFSRALLHVADGYEEPDPIQLTPEMFAAAEAIGDRISEKATEELRTAIRLTLEEVDALVELSPAETLRAIGYEPPQWRRTGEA